MQNRNSNVDGSTSASLEQNGVLAEVPGKVLNLTLHRAAFEVMVTGEKRLEFRTPGKWIDSRLFRKDGSRKPYDFIKFTNGYGSDKPYFICRYLGFEYEYGCFRYSNGLEVEVSNDYAIKCGQIVEVGNW